MEMEELLSAIKEIYRADQQRLEALKVQTNLTSVYIRKALLAIEQELLEGKNKLSGSVVREFLGVFGYLARHEEGTTLFEVFERLKQMLEQHRLIDG